MTSSKDAHVMNAELLLERANRMEPQALGQIHDRFYPVVYRYVRYRLDDEQVVEDISSDVFLRLLDHLHRQKGTIHDLRAWLLGTASNLVNDHLRHKYRRPTENIDEHEWIPSNEDLHQTAEQDESRSAVREAMIHLTREQQHVLALRFSQGFSIEETAQTMNKTAGAIKVLQFRALAAVRKILEARERVR